MQIMARSRLVPPGTPALRLTLRRRECGRCHRPSRVTLYSPSTALETAMTGAPDAFARALAGLPPALDPEPVAALDTGQCCIRCTRGLRA